MATRQYVGARYVPIFDGDWDNTKDYEPLVIVSYQGNSYTSRTFVPHGTAITNATYWALTGNYNAQVEAYRREVAALSDELDKFKVFVTPEMYGAKGDGVTDDTEAINEALSVGGLIIFKENATYLVDATDSLLPVSNSLIDLNNSIIKSRPTAEETYNIFYLDNVENIHICNGIILGERDNHLASSGDHGIGINVNNASNIVLENLEIDKCWGDGVYVGGNSNTVKISKCILDNNRRLGIAVTYGENIFITENVIKNTMGTEPQAGINVEPNANQAAKHVIINGNRFIDNVNGVEAHKTAATIEVEDLIISSNEFSDVGATDDSRIDGRLIYITDIDICNITGNTFKTNSTEHMVYVGGNGFNVSDNVFHDSTCLYAILSILKDSTIANNIISNIVTSGNIFAFEHMQDVSVIGNTITNVENVTLGDGFLCYIRGTDATTGACKNNIIKDNIIKDVTLKYVFAFNQYSISNLFVDNVIDGSYEYIAYDRTANCQNNDFYTNWMKDGSVGTSGHYAGSTYEGVFVQNIIDGVLVP